MSKSIILTLHGKPQILFFPWRLFAFIVLQIFFNLRPKKKKGRAFTAIHRINTFYKGIYGENKQSNVAIPYTLILSDVSFTNFLILQRATVLQFWSWGPGTSFKETLSLWFPKSCMQKKKKKVRVYKHSHHMLFREEVHSRLSKRITQGKEPLVAVV